MKQVPQSKQPAFYRPTLTQFARILLTVSHDSPGSILIFLLGVAALGSLANLVFGMAYDPGTFSWDKLVRVLLVIAGCVILGYGVYRYNLKRWQQRNFTATFDEQARAAPHAGLIWLMSIGKIDLPYAAIQYHLGKHGDQLKVCWVLRTNDAKDAYESLAARVAQSGFQLHLEPIDLEADTIEDTYRHVERIYAELAQKAGLTPDQIIADLTGGSKPMSAGMVLACLPHGRALEYIASNRDPATGQFIEGTQRVIKAGVDFHLA